MKAIPLAYDCRAARRSLTSTIRDAGSSLRIFLLQHLPTRKLISGNGAALNRRV